MSAPLPVLEVQSIGKAYRDYGGEWRRVLSWFGLPLAPREEHWTLQNISFSIQPGESVGIVGQNGAGKSTLLKLITGTLRPSTGQVTVRGRIAAILELGMGFHPDLTGRQNAYHAAGLMGHSQEQINAVIDDIEAFAEIGEYFDQPVRTYSSGMQMRVAFSVASAIRPDILIIDEALSVGDAYFQHKCFQRIREFRRKGTTLFFVSHDQQAIQGICDRAILLSSGSIIMEGPPEAVMDYYNALLAEKANTQVVQTEQDDGSIQTVSGTGEAQVIQVLILNEHDTPIEMINVGEWVTLRITAAIHHPIPRLVMGYGIKDRLGQVMYGTNTHHTGQVIEDLRAGQTVTYNCRFKANLGPGSYSIQTALVSSDTHLVNNYEWRDLAHIFTVTNINRHHFAGCNWMQPRIEVSAQ